MSNDSSSQPLAVLDPAAPVPQRLPWGSPSAILITLLAFIAAQLVAGLVVGFWPQLVHWPASQADGWLESVTGQFYFVVLAEGLTVLILYWFLRHRHASLRLLGYKRRPRWLDVGIAFIAFGVYFIALLVAVGAASAAFHIDVGQKQDLGFDVVTGGGEKLMAFISLVLLPPLVEETLFRGFLFTGLRRRLKLVWALLITSALFALPHLFESSSILWVAGIDTFILSVVLCYVREKTGNLYAGIFIHMIKNSLAFLTLYVFVGH